MKLPYPGFSWSISQHTGPAGNQQAMFRLLESAYRHAHEHNYQDLISQEMTEMGLLSPNVREHKGQAWRDYQQILPEIGLMRSTKITKQITVTPIGMLWLDGGIGYRELMTTQCLNYQYPNGFKQDISPTQRKLLQNNDIHTPETRTELDATHGVLIKPALLILRILIELLKSKRAPILSVSSCLEHVVPCARNHEWQTAYSAVTNKKTLPTHDTRRKRHIQEWFKILSYTDIFNLNGDHITLSEYAIHNIDELVTYCAKSEQPENFWIPTNFDKEKLSNSWFNYFGALPITQQILRSHSEMGINYINENYIDGVDDDTAEQENIVPWTAGLSLKPFFAFEEKNYGENRTFTDIDKDKIAHGKIVSAQRTILHDKIVNILANKLQRAGYAIFEDRNSVDLYAEKDNTSAIIEVKTVTARNLSSRIRLAIGQLSEYRYRRHKESNNRPHAILVLSNYAIYPEWVPDFFQNDLNMGLVSLHGESIFSHTAGRFETSLATIL